MTFAEAAVITPFSSPENSYQVLSDYLSGLEKSAYIEVYTFTSMEFADRIVEARNRGVDVRVIVDGNPAGDKVNTTVACYLRANNIPVYLHKRGAKYMHAKYIVGDNNSVAVLSENFGSDGFYWNRGWGVVIEDSGIVGEKLINVFTEDLKNSDRFDCKESIERKMSKTPEKIETKKFIEPEPQLIVAPDAVEGVVKLINSANKTLYIEQFYIYKDWKGKPNLFLESVVERARKGVDVKILMDSNYYNIQPGDSESNYNTAEYIRNISLSEKIPLQVKLANLQAMKVSKIHNKGLIIDNKTVLISSINWNENSPRNNREIGVAITGESAEYFLGKFLKDWPNSNFEDKGSAYAGRDLAKDYFSSSLKILVFILISGSIMILAKRRHRSRRFH